MPTIEQLIKQNKFQNEKHRALISIIYANNLVNRFYEEILGKFDLTLQQYNVMRILRGQYPTPSTVNLIRERMLDRMSDTSRIVERLRKTGLVERVKSQKDRRAVDIVITKKGLEILAKIDAHEEDWIKPALKLSEKDAVQLNGYLEKIFDMMAS